MQVSCGLTQPLADPSGDKFAADTRPSQEVKFHRVEDTTMDLGAAFLANLQNKGMQLSGLPGSFMLVLAVHIDILVHAVFLTPF